MGSFQSPTYPVSKISPDNEYYSDSTLCEKTTKVAIKSQLGQLITFYLEMMN